MFFFLDFLDFVLVFASHGGGTVEEIVEENRNYAAKYGTALYQTDVLFRMWNPVSSWFVKFFFVFLVVFNVD